MKLLHTVLRFFAVVLCSSFFCGCGVICKKTKITTVTEIKIDTVFKYVSDTSLLIAAKDKDSIIFFHDTVRIENDVSIAKGYFNTGTNKIEISLKGKIIDVPVTIQAIRTTTKEIPRKPKRWYIFYIAGFCTCLILIIILKR